MANNSYYLYQLYESRDSDDFYPSYPMVYSIDGDGTMEKVLRIENDVACGGTGFEPIYRWVRSTDPKDFICYKYSKYYKEYKQVSYNNGINWQFVEPTETRQSEEMMEYHSYDCGYEGEKERWVAVPDDYYCVECGDSPSVSSKARLMMIGGGVIDIFCDGSDTLTSDETKQYWTGITEVQIGSCITSIGVSAFDGNLFGMGENTNIQRVVIPENIVRLGGRTFRGNNNLKEILVYAKTPPSLGGADFYYTGDAPIYVPDESYELYYNDVFWSEYNYRIKKMSWRT